MAIRLPTAKTTRTVSPPPTSQVNKVAAPEAQPGHIQGITLHSRKIQAQCFQSRQNPVTAVSPVARVQRSISMFMKNWVVTPTMHAQNTTNPNL